MDYGDNYFGDENDTCMCISCEIKGTGHFKINDQIQGAYMVKPADYVADDDNINIQEIRKDLYKCAICKKTFLYKSWLALHITKHMEPTHTREKCDRVFNRIDALRRHVQITHVKTRHNCNKCQKNFSTPYGVTMHLNIVHGEEKIVINCIKCSKTFGTQERLDHHDNLSHTGIKPYICPNRLCNDKVETQYLLCMHRKTHGCRN